MPKKVILDVDTGTDDAVAIMVAAMAPELELVACCTVWGNHDVEHTTENTLKVLAAIGKEDIPVYKGCGTALVKYLYEDRIPQKKRELLVDGKPFDIHIETLNLPAAKTQAQELPAVLFYIEYLKQAAEPVTLIPVGPPTNVAAALQICPEIVQKIEKIIIMGGGDKVSNCTPASEGNIWHDPEAAQIILNSGAEVIWVPLDATHDACLDLKDCQRFRELNTFASNFAADMIEHRILAHDLGQPLKIPHAAAVHDALAVCAAIDETVLQDLQTVHVDIPLSGVAEGKTLIDRREVPDPPNSRFAFQGDREKFADMLATYFSFSR